MCVVKDYTDFKGKGCDPNYFYPVMPLCSKGNNEMVLIVKDLKKNKNFCEHKNCARNENRNKDVTLEKSVAYNEM